MRRMPLLRDGTRTVAESTIIVEYLDTHCAAARSLFYADWAHPIAPGLAHARAYRQRLLARPSVARAVDEARPFRAYFPLGAPDRD